MCTCKLPLPHEYNQAPPVGVHVCLPLQGVLSPIPGLLGITAVLDAMDVSCGMPTAAQQQVAAQRISKLLDEAVESGILDGLEDKLADLLIAGMPKPSINFFDNHDPADAGDHMKHECTMAIAVVAAAARLSKRCNINRWFESRWRHVFASLNALHTHKHTQAHTST